MTIEQFEKAESLIAMISELEDMRESVSFKYPKEVFASCPEHYVDFLKQAEQHVLNTTKKHIQEVIDLLKEEFEQL